MEEQLSLVYRRLEVLEHQVRLLSERAGVPCPLFASEEPSQFGGVPAEVLALARGGKAIAAIKLYRELTGVGLREAKAVIDSLR